jgi:hypothetical protein
MGAEIRDGAMPLAAEMAVPLAVSRQLGQSFSMNARSPEPPSTIPSARFDDLDLERQEDEEEWDRRVMALAAARIAAERARLERLGIINADGELVSRELPPDMLPESDTTLETG